MFINFQFSLFFSLVSFFFPKSLSLKQQLKMKIILYLAILIVPFVFPLCDQKCATCESGSCAVCHDGFYIFVRGDGTQRCTGCALDCYCQQAFCTSCHPQHFRIQGGNNFHCYDCLSNCLECVDNTSCTTCYPSYFWAGSSCEPCSSQCVECEGTSSNCTECSSQRFLISGTCSGCSSNCSTCVNSSTTCTSCQDGFYVDENSVCAPCMSLCYRCADGNSCITCLEPFEDYNCVQSCGNGLVLNNSYCDLEQGVQNDGCTDDCQIEPGYVCEMDDSTHKSSCFYESQISIEIESISKEIFKNQITIQFQIKPTLLIFSQQRPNNFFSLQGQVSDSQFFTISTIGLFSLTFNYHENLQGKNITLNINGSSFNLTQFSLKINTENPAYYYTDGQYVYCEFLHYFAIVLIALGLFIYFLGICSSKLAGLEIIYVLQYWFVQMIWIKSDLILPLYVLSVIKYTTGYNHQFHGESIENPSKAEFFNLKNSFSDNFNFSGFLYLPPLIGLIIISVKSFIADRKEKKANETDQKTDQLSERREKFFELTLYAVTFNYIFLLTNIIIFVSEGDFTNTSSFVFITIYSFITVAMLIFYIRSPSDFKRFYLSFQLYITYYYHAGVYIIYLTVMILFTTLLNMHPWTPFIPQIFIFLYTIIKKPYIDKMDNYRSAFNIFIMAVITSMGTFYFYVEETDPTWRVFVYPGVIELLIFIAIVWAYFITIKDIVYISLDKRPENLSYEYYGDQETIRKLERLILDSCMLRNDPSLQCQFKEIPTTKSEAQRKYYRGYSVRKKEKKSEKEINAEIKKQLKSASMNHSAEGVQMIKDEIGFLKLQKFIESRQEEKDYTSEEKKIYDAI